jgi:hypothetical protein
MPAGPILAEADEIFCGGTPCLTVVDGESFMVLNIAASDTRCETAWGVTFLDLMEQGVAFHDVAADGAVGICAGMNAAGLDVPLRPDLFHLIQEATKISKRLEQLAYQAMTETISSWKAFADRTRPKPRRGRPRKSKLQPDEAEAQEKVAIRIAEQFNDYFASDVVRNAVNMIAVEPQVAERLAPWQRLASTMGLVHAELMDGQFGEIEVGVSGDIRELPMRAFTAAVLKGFLTQLLDERINLVNAETVARTRGFEVREVRGANTDGYAGLLTVRLRSAEAEHVVEGAVFGKDHPKIVRVDEFYVETDAKGDVLFVQNDDVPGRLAALAAVIARHDVNIADFALGRHRESGQAMNAIHLDNPLPASALEEVGAVEGVRWARLVRMPS